MSLQRRLDKLERTAINPVREFDVKQASDEELMEIMRADSNFPYDITRLTDDELLAWCACYTAEGELIPERVTPEIEAAMKRVEVTI